MTPMSSNGSKTPVWMIAADHINQLLYPFTTTELAMLPVARRAPVPSLTHKTVWVSVPPKKWKLGSYTVKHMGLLDQIENTVTGSQTGGEVFHAAYGSKPAGRIDCLSFLARIDDQSLVLAARHHIELCPLRPRLGQLSAELGLKTDKTVTGWWVSARVLTQHDNPPLAPNAPCPNEECDQRGSLRVRFDPNVALCTHCGSTWSDDTDDPVESFGRLAVWVRWASEHLAGPEIHCQECREERQLRAERTEIRRATKHPKRVPA